MDKIYFLIFIGVLAFALVSWVVKIERKRTMEAKKQKTKAHHLAQVHHQHAPIVRHGLPGRTTSHPPRHIGAWEMRHQRAGEELRHGSAITADRILSDEEPAEIEPTHGLAMQAIKYVPEDAPKASQPRR